MPQFTSEKDSSLDKDSSLNEQNIKNESREKELKEKERKLKQKEEELKERELKEKEKELKEKERKLKEKEDKENKEKEIKDVFSKFVKKHGNTDRVEFNQPYNNKPRKELLIKYFSGQFDDNLDIIEAIKDKITYGLKLLIKHESKGRSPKKVNYTNLKGKLTPFVIRNDLDSLKFQFLKNLFLCVKNEQPIVHDTIQEPSSYINHRDSEANGKDLKFVVSLSINMVDKCQFKIGEKDVFIKSHFEEIKRGFSVESTNTVFLDKDKKLKDKIVIDDEQILQ